MKKTLLVLLMGVMVAMSSFGQAKKPTLMVVPSDAWCIQNGYVLEYDDQGTVKQIPDYQLALKSDMNLKLAIATINDLMAERGFPLKDLEQQIKLINQTNAELNMITSSNGNVMAESPMDRLLRTAKADIILELTWDMSQQGPKHSLT